MFRTDRPHPWMRRSGLAWCMVAALATMPPVIAQETPPSTNVRHALTEVMWTIDVNHDKPFEADALTDGEHVYLSEATFARLGFQADATPPAPMHPFKGRNYFLPQNIPRVEAKADFDRLALHLLVPGTLLKSQAIELTRSNVRPITPTPYFSGFLNYSYSQTRSQNAVYQSAWLSPHVRVGGWSLFDDHVLQDSPEGFHQTRLRTTAFRDWPSDALRFSVGDSVLDTGDLGIAIPFAGLRLQRTYSLQPGEITTPTATVAGVAQAPSVAQIYMDGVLIGETRVTPGPFSFQNLQNYGGLRTIQVVLRDATGGEQLYRVPFYFANNLLKAGLDTFDIGLGALRQRIGSGDYADYAGALSYLYGVTDNWTVGLHASAVPGDRRVTPLTTIGLGPLGTVTLINAWRDHHGLHRRASELNYSTQWPRTLWRFQWRHSQRGFDDPLPGSGIESVLPDLRARDSYTIGLSQALGRLGNVSINLAELRRFDGSVLHSASASWSTGLPGRGLFQLSGLSTHGAGTRLRGFMASIIYAFGQRGHVNTGYRRTTGSDPQIYAQASSDPPVSGGFGYRLYASHQEGLNDRDVDLEWRTSWMDMSVGARQVEAGGDERHAQRFSMAGSLAMVGGRVYATPTVDNAFAVVSVGYPGVGVYRSSTLVGKTDSQGTLLIPQLAPYAGTRLSVKEEDLPLDVDLVSPSMEVVPPDGAGLLLHFVLPKIAAVTGMLRFSPSLGAAPIDNHTIKVTTPSGAVVESRTGDRGFFELEQVTEGMYRIDVDGIDTRCNAHLSIPAHAPPIWQAGEVICE
ncbi:fimbria/pilus outer membrane usher protein [Dyella subtropica]|uniref:fimbria/pilus outer membrane usher protein n=1 Tax=Dyella subtropica TaxID=2992127 RepID=UPI0022513CC6|nr:fimbria/pilus outer membrane usher protein [Dyella subtropica]